VRIYIEKETSIDGKTRYFVMAGAKCLECTDTIEEAEKIFHWALERVKSGYSPSKEIIREENV